MFRVARSVPGQRSEIPWPIVIEGLVNLPQREGVELRRSCLRVAERRHHSGVLYMRIS